MSSDISEIARVSGSLWSFSLEVYANGAVQDACLNLQERHGLDVNILLLCCWLALRHKRIDGAEFDVVLAHTTEWQCNVVVPLRKIRRHIKSGVGLIPNGDSEVLRVRIKSLELEAERIEQQQLEFTVLHKMELVSDGRDCSSLAISNLDAYFVALQIEPNKWDLQDLKILSE